MGHVKREAESRFRSSNSGAGKGADDRLHLLGAKSAGVMHCSAIDGVLRACLARTRDESSKIHTRPEYN